MPDLRQWRTLPVCRFVETPTFSARVYRYLSEAEYRELQLSLLLRPDQAPIVAGSRGLRKLRWKGSGRGKRGGVRLVYYWRQADETVFMLFIYAKSEQGDLTAPQSKALVRLVEQEFE